MSKAVDIADVTNQASFRNLIINGDFRVNQRGAASRTENENAYNYDRWYYDGEYLYQGVEDKSVANGTYTLTWVDAGSDITAAYIVSTDSSNNNGPDSGLTYISVSNGGNITVSEGTEYSKHLWIRFGGTLANLSKVQLEAGTVATPFERRLIGTELALCQRYYEKIQYTIGAVAGSVSSRGTRFPFRLCVEKRASPTVIITSTSTVRCSAPTASEVYSSSVTLRTTNSNTDGDDYVASGSFVAEAEI